MADDTLVSVQGLYRFFGTTAAVADVSFEIRRGEVLGFLGPNGAGKTTTMRMLTGNLAPSRGAIAINGIDLLENPAAAKRALGYLPDQPPLYRELTVDEYLTFCARINGVERREVASAVARARERCGLEQVGRRLIGNLSKGYQQRVGIAQAIIHRPEVVILDEPTVGLDPIQVRGIRELIRELGGEHSVILSTHILPEVQTVCDRVQIINGGRLVMSDSIAALQESALQVGLRRPPTPEALQALPGVTGVRELAEGRLLVEHTPGNNPAEAIAAAAATGDWGLYELSPQRTTLEDLFINIVTADQGGAEVAA